MNDQPPSDVLGALPRTRPHRRSGKRPARPAVADEVRESLDGAVETPAAEAIEAPAAPAKPGRAGAAGAAKARGATPPNARAVTAPKARAVTAPRARAVRAAKPAGTTAAKPRHKRQRLAQPAQPGGTPSPARGRKPVPPSPPDVVGTAVQAAAELAEIGLAVSARALRRAVSRLPRP